MNSVATKNKKNETIKKEIITQKISTIELIVIFLVILSFGFMVYLLISQIYLLNLELKNLVSLVQSLQENQTDLNNQLLLKDQQVKILENTIKDLNSSLLNGNDNQNFELFKKEIIKNNNKMSQFYLKTGILIFGTVLFFKCIKFLL